jgi:hypothetical protein
MFTHFAPYTAALENRSFDALVRVWASGYTEKQQTAKRCGKPHFPIL